MANHALTSNPPNALIHITTHGSDWLWAVFALMLLADLIVFFHHLTIPRGQRVFHHLSMFILTTAAIAYFAMASDLGATPITTEFSHYSNYPQGVSRQVWYARYIDWVITTPCLLLTLVLASGLPLSDIFALVFFDLVMIVTGLIGSLTASSYKWGFFLFGMLALAYIWYVLVGPARVSARLLGPAYGKTFTTSAILLSFLWLLYPIAWGLADGGNVISPNGEMVFYGILDLLAKPVFIFLHLGMLSKLDLSLLQLQSGKWSSGATFVGDREKYGTGVGGVGHGTGAGGVGPGTGVGGVGHHTGMGGVGHDNGVGAGTGTGAGVGFGRSAGPATTGTTATGTGKRGLFGRKTRHEEPVSTVGTSSDATNAPLTSESTAPQL